MDREEHGMPQPHVGFGPYDPDEHYHCDCYVGMSARTERGGFCRNRAQFVIHKYVRTTLFVQGFYCREHITQAMRDQQRLNRERTQTGQPLRLGFEVTSLRNPPDPIPYPVLTDNDIG